MQSSPYALSAPTWAVRLGRKTAQKEYDTCRPPIPEQDAGGLYVLVDRWVAEKLGLEAASDCSAHLGLLSIDAEKSLGEIRPDLLGHTAEGLAVAIEVAYSSFCDLLKVAQFIQLGCRHWKSTCGRFRRKASSPERCARLFWTACLARHGSGRDGQTRPSSMTEQPGMCRPHRWRRSQPGHGCRKRSSRSRDDGCR